MRALLLPLLLCSIALARPHTVTDRFGATLTIDKTTLTLTDPQGQATARLTRAEAAELANYVEKAYHTRTDYPGTKKTTFGPIRLADGTTVAVLVRQAQAVIWIGNGGNDRFLAITANNQPTLLRLLR